MADVACPICGYRDSPYVVRLHVDAEHADDSQFAVRNDVPNHALPTPPDSRPTSDSSGNSMPADRWVKCTRRGCGETIPLADADEHLDFHAAEEIDAIENGVQPRIELREPSRAHDGSARPGPSASQQRRSPRKLEIRGSTSREPPSRAMSMLSWLSGSTSIGRPPSRGAPPRRIPPPLNPGRLGKQELGPHAFEERMPEEVRLHLLNAARPREIQRLGRDARLYRKIIIENETRDLIPALVDAFSLDEDTAVTYFCHPSTRHVYKLPCDGNFCGYWNIQMVLTYFQHIDPGRNANTPNVLQIQDIIERAWTKGICSYGKIETGGIKNTRKWIGTHEALAFFTEMGIEVDALAFKNGDEGSEKVGAEELLDHIEAYFMSGIDAAEEFRKGFTTRLPPIYFQKFGHSMTIVGLERKIDGSRNLLVFDSSFATPRPIQALIQDGRTRCNLDDVLRVYRRSDASLSRWEEFEILVPKMAVITKPLLDEDEHPPTLPPRRDQRHRHR